jgi:hypothetical protein
MAFGSTGILVSRAKTCPATFGSCFALINDFVGIYWFIEFLHVN